MTTTKIDLMCKLRKAIRPQPSLEDVFAILSDFKIWVEPRLKHSRFCSNFDQSLKTKRPKTASSK
jgi:hypothetical protein